MNVVVQGLGFVFLRESMLSVAFSPSSSSCFNNLTFLYPPAFPPILLERKANRIKKEMGIALDDTSRVHTPFQGEDRQ